MYSWSKLICINKDSKRKCLNVKLIEPTGNKGKKDFKFDSLEANWTNIELKVNETESKCVGVLAVKIKWKCL